MLKTKQSKKHITTTTDENDDMKEENDQVKQEDPDKLDQEKDKDNDDPDKETAEPAEEEEEEQQENDDEEEEEQENDDDEEEDEDEDEEEDSDNEKTPQQSLQQQLKQFPKVAATGQLFLKYTGKRRRKPQDRIVKVSFDSQGTAKQISWGSGSRHIDFSDILYISHGHYTPVFISRKDQLDGELCFSVVGKTQILDVQASTKQLALLWVKGLRRLIGQSDADALKLAQQNMESGNLPGSSGGGNGNGNGNGGGGGGNNKKDANVAQDHKKRTKSLMLLQQDLFVMTTTTVFRNLEEERVWEIDQGVRDRFNAKLLYEEALRQDIPWRQWNHWIREKIVTYLRENNRVAHHQNSSIITPIFNGDFTTPMSAPIVNPNYVVPPQNNVVNNNPQPIPIITKPSNPSVSKPQQQQQQQQQDENCTLM